jgi:hypothetical protein
VLERGILDSETLAGVLDPLPLTSPGVPGKERKP